MFVDNSFMQFLGRCYNGSNRNLEMGALLYTILHEWLLKYNLLILPVLKAKPKLELHSISIHRIQNYYRIVENHKLKRCQFCVDEILRVNNSFNFFFYFMKEFVWFVKQFILDNLRDLSTL